MQGDSGQDSKASSLFGMERGWLRNRLDLDWGDGGQGGDRLDAHVDVTEVTYRRKLARFTVKNFLSGCRSSEDSIQQALPGKKRTITLMAKDGSGQNALDVHVQKQIQEDGERQQPDGNQGNEVDFAANGLEVFE